MLSTILAHKFVCVFGFLITETSRPFTTLDCSRAKVYSCFISCQPYYHCHITSNNLNYIPNSFVQLSFHYSHLELCNYEVLISYSLLPPERLWFDTEKNKKRISIVSSKILIILAIYPCFSSQPLILHSKSFKTSNPHLSPCCHSGKGISNTFTME